MVGLSLRTLNSLSSLSAYRIPPCFGSGYLVNAASTDDNDTSLYSSLLSDEQKPVPRVELGLELSSSHSSRFEPGFSRFNFSPSSQITNLSLSKGAALGHLTNSILNFSIFTLGARNARFVHDLGKEFSEESQQIAVDLLKL